jgi:E3 ubiquitin-protein ligase CCNP1IP1
VLENRNFDLNNAFKQKARAQEDLTKKYQVLKKEKMQSHAMNAASDEAEQVLHSVTANRFTNRPGPQGAYFGTYQGIGEEYRPPLSASSGSVEGVRGLRAGPGQAWHSQKQSHRGYTSR